MSKIENKTQNNENKLMKISDNSLDQSTMNKDLKNKIEISEINSSKINNRNELFPNDNELSEERKVEISNSKVKKNKSKIKKNNINELFDNEFNVDPLPKGYCEANSPTENESIEFKRKNSEKTKKILMIVIPVLIIFGISFYFFYYLFVKD